jgi:diguanylate cyclase
MDDFGFIDEDDEALAAAALIKRSLADTTERPRAQELTRVAHGFVPTIAGADWACFARIGGEEIINMLPGLELDAGHAAAEQFRRLTESLSGGGLVLPQIHHFSGSGRLPTTDRNLDGLLQRADHVLYRAKELGRNRVQTAL